MYLYRRSNVTYADNVSLISVQNDFPTIRQLDTFCQLLLMLATAGEFDAVAALAEVLG